MFDDTVLTAPSARRLFIDFAEAIVEIKRYEQIVKGMVIKGCPTSRLLFGNELGSYNGQPNSVQLKNGIYLFTNFSRKAVRKKIDTLALQLGIDYKILKWAQVFELCYLQLGNVVLFCR